MINVFIGYDAREAAVIWAGYPGNVFVLKRA